MRIIQGAMTREVRPTSHVVHVINGLILCSALLFAACAGPGNQALPEPYPTTPSQDLQLRTYDAFWDGINERYLYKEHTDLDWELLKPLTRRKIQDGMTRPEFEDLMRSTVASFPSDTVTYLTRSERTEQDLGNTLSYEGIGAYITVENQPEPHVILLAVISGSPAEKAGLHAHESIYAVDGQKVTAEEGLQVVNRVRGPGGSVVTLDVQAPDGSKRTVNVTRGRVIAEDQLRWGMIGMSNTGLIRLPISANEGLSDMLIDALRGLSEEGIGSLIIDMRIAHSSSSWPLVEMLSLFGDGQMGELRIKGSDQALNVSANEVLNSQTLPLALLVGPDTQGPSEIFAAGLQASDRAVVLGLPTTGRVMGFDQFILPDGSKIFYAISSYHTPDGKDIGIVGVQPDIVVNARWDEVNDDSDPVISRALLHLTQ